VLCRREELGPKKRIAASLLGISADQWKGILTPKVADENVQTKQPRYRMPFQMDEQVRESLTSLLPEVTWPNLNSPIGKTIDTEILEALYETYVKTDEMNWRSAGKTAFAKFMSRCEQTKTNNLTNRGPARILVELSVKFLLALEAGKGGHRTFLPKERRVSWQEVCLVES